MRNGTREALIVCFARLMRCAIVLSGTRKALAISAVVKSADGAQGERDGRRMGQRGMTTHEQQDERVIPLRRSGIAEPRPGIGDEGRAASSRGRAWPCRCGKIRHAACGHVNQPSARVVGHPFLRPLHARGDERLLHRVFGGGKILEAADGRAENLRRELAQQILGVASSRGAVTPRRAARS